MNFRELKDKLKAKGEIPNWYSTNALQFFMESYSYKGESVKSRDETTNKFLAKYAPKVYPDWWNEDEYFKGLTWNRLLTNCLGMVIVSTLHHSKLMEGCQIEV